MVKRAPLIFILLLSLAAVVQAQDTPPQSIEIGQAVTGTLADSSAMDSYQFSAQAGDFFIVTMNSDNLDSMVIVVDGPDVAPYYSSDDDSGGNDNARLGFIVPETGTYIVVAATFTVEGGSYELVINRDTPLTLEFDQPLDVSFDAEHPVFYFTFTGKAGNVINLDGSSMDGPDGLDTHLELTNPGGLLIAIDHDSGGGFNPFIGNEVLSYDGEYLAALYLDDLSSEYEIKGIVTVTLSYGAATSLDNGPVAFTLGDSQYVTTFQGIAGEAVTLNLTTQSGTPMRPFITILQGVDTIAKVNTDDVQNLALTLVAPNDGLVTIVMRQDDSGTFELALNRDTAPLESGQPVNNAESLDNGLGVFDKGYHATSFTGVAGQTVNLTLALQSGTNMDPRITFYMPGLGSTVDVFANGVQSLSFDLVIPNDGLVMVEVDQRFDATLAVSLTRLE
ncbi:MAG: PPC domain-containing protein [Anaerolineaceae bacterium]|nr:PPC domain-containing protein [Anaerolineaceae bacterium]